MASQCTFANNYLFSVPTLPILNVFNIEFSDGSIGKIRGNFDNCIIHGMGKIPELNDSTLDRYDIYMRYCLLRSSGNDDAHFINCVWEGDPHFLVNRDDYIFDYRLGNESDAIGKGNPDLCPQEARYDRYGNDRLAKGSVDLGAYVWVYVPDEEE